MLLRFMLVSTTALTVGISSAAIAQDAPAPAAVPTPTAADPAPVAPAASAPGNAGVGEIVVTAERRSTSLQKTPVSIQTYSGADLTKRGVNNITDLAATDSSVNIGYSSGMPIIAVRGISSSNATESGDPAVSVATDGVFTNRPYGLFGGLYDIARVEILRGPQGTLFGRNSTGGTLNVITNHATHTDDAQITAEAGNYNLVAGEGYANFIVNDWLDARASFDYRSHSGYRNNDPARADGDDEDLKSGRFQIAFHPGTHLTGWLMAQYTDQGGLGQVSDQVPFTFVPGSTTEPVHTKPADLGNGRSFAIYSPYVRDLKSTDIRGGLTYKFDNDMTLSYLGGYNTIDYYRQQSNNGGYYTGDPTTPLIYGNTEKPKTVNQEVRLASASNTPFTWQVGGYFFREVSSVYAFTELNPDSSIAQRGVAFDYPRLTSTSKALFGQASYAITDTLKVTAGGRYTWDRKSRDGTFYLYPLVGVPFIIPVDESGEVSSHKFTWSAGLDYQFTPRNLLYAKVSTGYKEGGFNTGAPNYGPETVTSYEIGSKNSFFENHLQLNLSGFRLDYKNQQVAQFLSGAQTTGSYTVNAGSSRIYGIEANIVAQDQRFGRLELSANYLHARYLKFVSSAGWDPSINLDLSGNTLPLAPTFAMSAQYEYPVELSSGAVVTPRLIVKSETKKYFTPNDYEDSEQKAYALVDLGLDFAPASKKWLLQAYIKNVANKTVLVDASEGYVFNAYSYSYQPPRTFGGRLTINFH